MNAPNFFVLGAARCGTTALCRYLQVHPDVLISRPKEPLFFELEYERGVQYYWSTYFRDWNGQRAVGDARVANLVLPYVAERIRATVPDARLLVILREPGRRAHSHWWMRRCHGVEKRSLADALAEERALPDLGARFAGEDGERRWRASFDRRGRRSLTSLYLECGYYAQQIERYLGLFDREQLRVLWLEDLRSDARALVRGVWEFLGLNPDVQLHDVAPHNDSIPRPITRLLRAARALGITERVPVRVRRPVRRALGRLGGAPPMAPQTRTWLYEHYAPHVRDLEALLKVDLPAWRRPTAARGGVGGGP